CSSSRPRFTPRRTPSAAGSNSGRGRALPSGRSTTIFGTSGYARADGSATMARPRTCCWRFVSPFRRCWFIESPHEPPCSRWWPSRRSTRSVESRSWTPRSGSSSGYRHDSKVGFRNGSSRTSRETNLRGTPASVAFSLPPLLHLLGMVVVVRERVMDGGEVVVRRDGFEALVLVHDTSGDVAL